LTNDCKAVNFTEHPNIKEDISQQHSFSVFGFDVLRDGEIPEDFWPGATQND
jgi:hypothetical protein